MFVSTTNATSSVANVRRRFMRGGKQRRETEWIGISPALITVAAAGTATLIATLNAAALALRPFTIVRTRGFIWGRSDQVGATENWGAHYGICVVSDQAAAIGVTAIPTPFTDQDSQLFFVYEEVFGRFEFVSGVGVLEIGAASGLRSFDSKAMRKVNGTEDVAFVVETNTIVSSCGFYDSGRMLIKLH